MKKIKYGLPVLSEYQIQPYLQEKGIQLWKQLRQPQDLDSYKAGLGIQDSGLKKEVERFGPKNEALWLENPSTGEEFRGFRTASQKDGTTVFTLLPGDLVAVAAEYKHGAHTISLLPPGGNFSPKDRESSNPAATCGKREFEEETGIILEKCVSLGRIACQPRAYTECWHPCLGLVHDEVQVKPVNHDKDELIAVFLTPLADWWNMLICARVDDASSYLVTMLALAHLDRLQPK